MLRTMPIAHSEGGQSGEQLRTCDVVNHYGPTDTHVGPAHDRRCQPEDTSATSAGAVDPLNDPSNILYKRSVYFDYDQYSVKEEYRALVEAHGKFLAANPNRKVTIQGNTDERGGSEYNLALGQKRAEAVRRAMALAGARDSQMEAVSFGKEKPKASGSDEAAWAENRRDDIAY
jgi:peptidoglycan-associated lipoprotein